MVLTRTTVGNVHRLSGTIAEVMTELSTVGVKPHQIIWYLDGGTNAQCVFING